MPKLTMLSAPSASGKTTLAVSMLKEDSNAIRINRDDLRKMSIPKWSGRREEWIIAAEVNLAKTAASHKLNIIIDDTNLLERDEDRWKNVAKEVGYEFKSVKLEVSLEECIARDKLRGPAKIGLAAIERQFLRAGLWNVPASRKTVIFDIDGTLADLQHRVNWIRVGSKCPNCNGEGEYLDSWANPTRCKCLYCIGTGIIGKKNHDMFYGLVHLDPPIDIVVRWIKACYPEFYVLIVTGRGPERGCDEATAGWLAKHGIKYDHIIMRRNGMHGPDNEEKQLILDMILKVIPKEDIAFVVDDRPQVITMWKQNGLRVIPVRGREDDKFYEIEEKRCEQLQ